MKLRGGQKADYQFNEAVDEPVVESIVVQTLSPKFGVLSQLDTLFHHYFTEYEEKLFILGNSKLTQLFEELIDLMLLCHSIVNLRKLHPLLKVLSESALELVWDLILELLEYVTNVEL